MAREARLRLGLRALGLSGHVDMKDLELRAYLSYSEDLLKSKV